MTLKQLPWYFLLAVSVFAVSCSPTRKLSDGEHLLVKNVIRSDSKIVSRNDMESFIRQKPNRKLFVLLFFRFHLQVHNLVNQEKLEKRVTVLTS